jgi:hypothetical protein
VEKGIKVKGSISVNEIGGYTYGGNIGRGTLLSKELSGGQAIYLGYIQLTNILKRDEKLLNQKV